MDSKIAFDIFKNIIIAENKVFLDRIAEKTGTNPDKLRLKYIKPEYYLPVKVVSDNASVQNPVKNKLKDYPQ
jgi:hypothetical protein